MENAQHGSRKSSSQFLRPLSPPTCLPFISESNSTQGVAFSLSIFPRLGWKHAAPLPSIRQMSRQVSRGSVGEYQADERAGVVRLISLILAS